MFNAFQRTVAHNTVFGGIIKTKRMIRDAAAAPLFSSNIHYSTSRRRVARCPQRDGKSPPNRAWRYRRIHYRRLTSRDAESANQGTAESRGHSNCCAADFKLKKFGI